MDSEPFEWGDPEDEDEYDDIEECQDLESDFTV